MSLPNQAAEAESNETYTPTPYVEVCHVKTLPTENSLKEAAETLLRAVDGIKTNHTEIKSGLIRLEVPVPRDVDALHWLRGQQSACDSSAVLHPHVYFSPRRSSAPDTEGSIAAGAAGAGSGSVAGAGFAWMWKGAPSQPLNDGTMASMRRFLGTDNPRVRVFGGTRFDPGIQPAPEWEEFGSYYFVLPR